MDTKKIAAVEYGWVVDISLKKEGYFSYICN